MLDGDVRNIGNVELHREFGHRFLTRTCSEQSSQSVFFFLSLSSFSPPFFSPPNVGCVTSLNSFSVVGFDGAGSAG